MLGYDESKKLYGAIHRGDEQEAVEFLARHAGSGPALELGIGTGRLALPLAARGIRVDGIDISPPTVALLRARPGGDTISVSIGDFADLPVSGTYRLIYVVWNTFFNQPSQAAQVRCFHRVAAHLQQDGAFVVEAYVPSFLHRLRGNQHVDAEGVEVDEVRLDVLRHDPVLQRIDENHVSISAAGIEMSPVAQRYAWPCELDLMAQLAGLALKERWGGWHGELFTAESPRHVSVFAR